MQRRSVLSRLMQNDWFEESVLLAQIMYLDYEWQEGWISAKHCMRVDTVLYCFGKVQHGIRPYPAIILLIKIQ
jgi:hypothetical protein